MATKESLDAAYQTAYQDERNKMMRLVREEKERKRQSTISKQSVGEPIRIKEHSTDRKQRQVSSTPESSGRPPQGSAQDPKIPSLSSAAPEPPLRSRTDFKIPERATAAPASIPSKRSFSEGANTPNASSTSRSSSSREPPDWYVGTKTKSGQARAQPGRRELLERLKQIRPLIAKCREKSPEAFNRMREYLHDMAFEYGIDEGILKDAKMLDNESGLPQVFDVDFFPFDVKADAEELYIKWCKRDFDVNLFRGIEFGRRQKGNHGADSFKEDYSKKGADIFGDNDLVNGQWWPTQLTTVRDGAHGVPQGGIYGSRKKGAYSIVMSHGYKDDVDEGHDVWYCGTNIDKGAPDGRGAEATANTEAMITSVKTGVAVRVLRSHNMPANSQFRPQCGFRYDGLYTVVSYEILDVERAIHRFHLRRRPRQMPIRFKGPEARPTDQEKREYENDKRTKSSSEN
ncbi:hypothetical protein EV356DRAFT_86905 [Viridothelium virens]|uniref:YDG domain-containing protein n=1 Tax=Viridothelium virens TaxID=1048519 RepID=A0A6A6HFA5_VIRVR|nr:hypothetical protein EV356DRAFT_86905 [Viridothelium virens]